MTGNKLFKKSHAVHEDWASQTEEALKQEAAPLDEKSFPTAVGMDGWPLDPTTELHIKAPRAGEPEGLDSIFGAPPGPNDQVKIVTVQEQLETLYRFGFRGQAMFNISAGPHPLLRSKTERISRANKYPPTECQVCTALISGEEKMHGYRLLELKHAGVFGCETCKSLYTGITRLAGRLGVVYEDWESEVEQETLDDSKLLAESTFIGVRFVLDGETTASIGFTCDGVNAWSSGHAIPQKRIMDTSSYEVVELARGWLTKCQQEHEECNIAKKALFPTRLIEVGNYRAKLCNTEGKIGGYLALSHCWGLKPIIRTEKASLAEWMVDIPWNSLSKTFQDAIIFTWKLGFKYIWIDSLCIIQDDNDDWQVQASKMATVFNNAQATISATRSPDGAGGCFSDRYNEPYKFTHQDLTQELSDPELFHPYEVQARDRDGILKNFFFNLKPQHGILESPLVQRAWVFQEQILSPRIIHFAPGEMYWECKSYVSCECTGWKKRSETLELATRQRKAHTQLIGMQASLRNLPPESSEKENERDLEAYEALVEQYTAMNITKGLDCLPALSGITSGRNDEYLAGMWKSFLLPSLHWISIRSKHHKMTYRAEVYRAPSWSWAAVQGPVRHLHQASYKREKGDMAFATVLAAICTPEGKDPRGRVTGGYLKIQGQASNARISRLGVRDRSGNAESDTYADLTCGGATVQCHLDIPLVIGKIQPAELSVGNDVVLLRISGYAALVLDSIEDTPGAYRRVGILRIEDAKVEQSIFPHAGKSSLFIW